MASDGPNDCELEAQFVFTITDVLIKPISAMAAGKECPACNPSILADIKKLRRTWPSALLRVHRLNRHFYSQSASRLLITSPEAELDGTRANVLTLHSHPLPQLSHSFISFILSLVTYK